MTAWSVLAVAVVVAGNGHGAAPVKNTTVTLDGKGSVTIEGTAITCAQVEAVLDKFVKESKGKIKPSPCYEHPARRK